jgi:hypothetical protein
MPPVNDYFDSPEEFFEKTASTLSKALLSGAGKVWGLVKKPGFYIPAAITSGTLGAAGLVTGFTGVSAAAEGKHPGDTLSYRINRGLHSLYDRVKADEQFGQAFAGNLGTEAAKSLIGLTKDMVSKGVETFKERTQLSPARRAIFTALKNEDPNLAMADNKTLLEAYHTMSQVAPTLSTDKNAVKSFLREAATSGGGLDFHSIKGIAEAETAVNKAKSGGLT